MFRSRFLRSAAAALAVYGLVGLLTAAVMLFVGATALDRVVRLQRTFDGERLALVQSILTVSGTLRDTAGATTGFQRSIDDARGAADRASGLANDSAGTFRQTGATLDGLSVFGVQPLAGVRPQFDRSADQLQQLAIALGSTRDALGQNGADVQRVGADLTRLQGELDAVARSLGEPGLLGLDGQDLLPFQLAFYGLCVLVILQSALSLVVGVAVFRLSRMLGSAPLFPDARVLEGPPPAPRRAPVVAL
jgi:hypothetical protein